MNIGEAVEELKKGLFVTRKGWNGKNMWLGIRWAEAETCMTEPYVYIKTAQGAKIPWLCSQADLLATDWEVVG
jgi:hypothetical protein